jgi:hypothetical protein
MPPGRPSAGIDWIDVSYNSCNYVVGIISHKDAYIKCIIDSNDKEKVSKHNWCVVGGEYIGRFVKHDSVRKTQYLHNYIMDIDTYDGKGQTKSIDHINGIGFDNRKSNLRHISQSLQNMNTKDRKRTSNKLPEDINPSDIPRNIWYIPASGFHGDRFAVEIKGIPDMGDICKKTTSSKDVTTREKLAIAIQIKKQIHEEH